jgi:ferredoxin
MRNDTLRSPSRYGAGMSTITFVQPDGGRIALEGTIGETSMQLAVRNDVKGILAECGGSCACATCHVIPAFGKWQATSLSGMGHTDIYNI